ncbi:tudor domain-containing protein 5 isoform X1 [Triplophysa dalaica]|uniref:tudor domain-containing protein 5 isoform X1 n=1 Tax=Triplophysa dalaica TaxID=1582913 RepID=UPI0024DFCF1C|nr:tudor domain-containing protein 5 isoform X1 [Triplophysa dalaica]
MTQDQLLTGLRKDVRSLLISAKHGLTPEQLRRDYQLMLGYPMPLRLLGFHSVLDMVKEMPDVVRMKFNLDGSIILKAIGDESTKGIEELVSKQRDKFKANHRKGKSKIFHVRYPHQSVILPRRNQSVPPLPAHLRSQLKQLLSHGPVRLSDLESRYTAQFGKPLQITQFGFFSISEMLVAATDIIVMQQSRTGSQLMLRNTARQENVISGVSKQLAKVKPVVLSHKAATPQKCEQTQQVSQVHPTAPKQDPLKTEDSFQEIVVKLEKELRHQILEKGTAGTVCRELKDKIRQVVAENSNGISIHNLPKEYKRTYGEELPVSQCGFLSVTEMVGALNDTLALQPGTEDGENRWIIVETKPNDTDPTETELSPGHDTTSSMDAESPNASSKGFYFSCTQSAWECEDEELSTDSQDSDSELTVTDKTIHQIEDFLPLLMVSQWTVVPPDAVLCQKLKPPTRRKERELVPVLVEHIESPSHFYVRFSQNKEARALENMMIEMRSCYSCPDIKERYRLPDDYVRPGQVCCVAPRDMWFYRVVIHEIHSDTEVTVYYVDFGDITKVERNSLRFLKACYADLAAQAVPSMLAGIRPSTSSWTQRAIGSFQRMCCDRTLVAAVHSYQENFLLLFLCETSTDEDIYTHLALHEEGHALLCTTTYGLLSGQFNPLNFYLGNDRLEDIEHVSSSSSHRGATNGQSSEVPSKDVDPFSDLPELEFIHIPEVNISSENIKQTEVQQNEAVLSSNEWDHGWTEEKKTVKTDLQSDVQTEEGLRPDKMPESPDPPVQAPVDGPQKCGIPPEPKPVAQSRCASPIPLRTSQTPCQVQTKRSYAGLPVYPIQPQISNFMLQLFSSSEKPRSNMLFQHHVSPFALRPGARLSASPLMLHQWCTKKKA